MAGLFSGHQCIKSPIFQLPYFLFALNCGVKNLLSSYKGTIDYNTFQLNCRSPLLAANKDAISRTDSNRWFVPVPGFLREKFCRKLLISATVAHFLGARCAADVGAWVKCTTVGVMEHLLCDWHSKFAVQTYSVYRLNNRMVIGGNGLKSPVFFYPSHFSHRRRKIGSLRR